MKAYHNEIINNIVSYVALKYFETKQLYITQTLLYKILDLFDFRCIKRRGSHCIEFTYTARKRGPVPEELYNGDLSVFDSFKT